MTTGTLERKPPAIPDPLDQTDTSGDAAPTELVGSAFFADLVRAH